MSYIMGQATAPSSSTVPLLTVPPGLCNVNFWTSGVPTLFIGTSVNVGPSNGLQCHSVPASFNSYVTSKGASFYCANTSATNTSVNYLLVTQ
jgi:hypothetical protein